MPKYVLRAPRLDRHRIDSALESEIREATRPLMARWSWAIGKIDFEGGGGCWLWTGALGYGGYGKSTVENRTVVAHRAMWVSAYGPIPDGLVIDHLCQVRRCINPGHLEVVTNRENVLRGNAIGAVHARRTHCARGHVLAGENVAVYQTSKGPMRKCRTCERQKARAARKRDAWVDTRYMSQIGDS